MANICPHCGSADTQAGFSAFNCTNCGRVFNPDGSPASVGPDAATKAHLLSKIRPKVPDVSGNLADLMRAGKAAVENDDPAVTVGAQAVANDPSATSPHPDRATAARFDDAVDKAAKALGLEVDESVPVTPDSGAVTVPEAKKEAKKR